MSYSAVYSGSQTCGDNGGGDDPDDPEPIYGPGGGGGGGGGYLVYSTTSSMTWTDPNGTAHLFDAALYQGENCDHTTSRSVSGGYATDASGYQVADDGSGNPVVNDSSGTRVFPQVIDRFGNYFSPDNGTDLIDDLGRTPVMTSQSGNQTFYDVLVPNGSINNNGKRARYIVTMEQLTLNTNFQQTGVVEYQNNHFVPGNSPYIPAIQSVQLPDGSSYQFSYDSYGNIYSVTLPTGGVVGYGWINYKDSYNNVNHWVGTQTLAGNTTTFTPAILSTCSSGSVGCQEQVTVQQASGDQTVYTLTLNNGAWDTATTIYSGPASAGQAKATDQAAYTFTRSCNNPSVCSGAQYITKATEVRTLPDANIATQLQSGYSNPQSGQVTSIGQWDYFPIGTTPSSLPTRQTNYGYTGYDLTSETHLDANGSAISTKSYNFTGAATATSGVVGHGNVNAGGPYLTSTLITNNLTSTVSTISATYEDTGNPLSVTDAKLNPPTRFTYDTTHTFVTEIDRPDTSTNGRTFHHVSKSSYDFYTGALLTSDDENSVALGQANTVRYTYEPIAGRISSIASPDGGSTTYAYPSATEVDTTTAQTANVGVTTIGVVDSYGRTSRASTGSISTTQTYDSNGRLFSTTSPSMNGSSSTDGTTYRYYDALGRLRSVINPDSSTRSVTSVGNVIAATDEIGNQTKQVFNAFGELISTLEPDPNSGALTLETDYQYDGLGNITCVEQHGNVSGTGCNAPASSDTTSPWRIRRFLYNSLSQLIAASIPEHSSLPSYPPQQNCGPGTGGNQWTDCYVYDANGNQTGKTDNTGATVTTTYDAIDRPLAETSANLHNLFSYDAGVNGVGLLYAQMNGDFFTSSTYGYDVMGRVSYEGSCRPDACGYVQTAAQYDLAGNMTQLTYPDGRVIVNGFDQFNRMNAVRYHQWGTQTIDTTYWSATSFAPPGELQTAQFGNGMQMQASFNNRQSLTSLMYQATAPAPAQTYFSKTFKWDKNATNLILQTDQVTSQERQFGYDKLNRLVSATAVTSVSTNAKGTAQITGFEGSFRNCTGGPSPSSAEAASSRASANLGGAQCTTTYDTGSLSVTVGPYSASVTYGRGSNPINLAANLASQLNASGLSATTNGTSTITLTAGSPSANYALSYSSDGDFNASFSDATLMAGTTTAPVAGGFNQQYSLDAWGNLSSMGTSGFSQLINGQNQVSGFSYDGAGRLISDGVNYYSYNDAGLLVSGGGIHPVYDALGNRVQLSGGGTEKEYYYFGGTLVATYIPSSHAWTDMIYANGQRIASVAGSMTASPLYFTPDSLGTQSGAVDNNGSQTASLDLTPFGQVLSGSSADSFVFTGLERDANGTDHAMYRQYSSSTARWTIPDPSDASYQTGDPQSFNRYTYVRNNPLAFTDLLGLQSSGSTACVVYGDCGTDGGDDFDWGDVVPFVTLGISELIDWLEGDGFNGNTTAQSQGKFVRRQPTFNNNPNAPTNDPISGPSSSGDFTGFSGGLYFSHGDPVHPQSKTCSADQSRFFDWLDNATIRGMASTLGTTSTMVFTLAAKEGGWTTGALDHNIPLNNPFGRNIINKLGQAAGNKGFPNLQAAVSDWQAHIIAAPFVQGIKDPGQFVDTLLAHGYNTNKVPYKKDFMSIAKSMPKHMAGCGVVP